MPDRASALVTILFTDLVGSTELLSRAGDEDAQRIFRARITNCWRRLPPPTGVPR
jgi:class 3 adenylate cyclase